MNNEDRILQILTEMQGDIKDLKQDVSALKQGQTRLEIIIENDVKPHIKTIVEQHGTIIEKLDALKEVNERVLMLQDSDTVQNVAIMELSRRTASI